jgi:hypothetical protein
MLGGEINAKAKLAEIPLKLGAGLSQTFLKGAGALTGIVTVHNVRR